MLHNLRSVAYWLRHEFKVDDRKVIIKVTDRSKIAHHGDGHTHWANKTFVILIAKDLSVPLRIETLLHEWAHAMTLPRRRERKNFHTHEWSRTLGLIHAARERYLGSP